PVEKAARRIGRRRRRLGDPQLARRPGHHHVRESAPDVERQPQLRHHCPLCRGGVIFAARYWPDATVAASPAPRAAVLLIAQPLRAVENTRGRTGPDLNRLVAAGEKAPEWSPVPRTRSSHHIAASPIANFGFKAALES